MCFICECHSFFSSTKERMSSNSFRSVACCSLNRTNFRSSSASLHTQQPCDDSSDEEKGLYKSQTVLDVYSMIQSAEAYIRRLHSLAMILVLNESHLLNFFFSFLHKTLQDIEWLYWSSMLYRYFSSSYFSSITRSSVQLANVRQRRTRKEHQ